MKVQERVVLLRADAAQNGVGVAVARKAVRQGAPIFKEGWGSEDVQIHEIRNSRGWHNLKCPRLRRSWEFVFFLRGKSGSGVGRSGNDNKERGRVLTYVQALCTQSVGEINSHSPGRL